MCWIIPFLVGLILGILGYMLFRSWFGGSSSNDDHGSRGQIRGSAAYTDSSSTAASSSLAAGSAASDEEGVWDKTKDAAADVKDAVVDTAEDVIDGAKELASDAAEAVGDVVDGAVELASDAGEAVSDGAASLVDGAGELASDAGKAVSAGAASVAAGLGLNLVDFDGDAAKAVFGKRVKQDDLTFVEGIGPKIAELFHNQGIKTWADLAVCSEERCREVLKSGGERFAIHVPTTWPRQAKMAAEGEWQALFDWQEKLDGGKE